MNEKNPGYIYLMQCSNLPPYIGISFIRRCKIGMTSNPEARLQQILSNQPPCDIKIIRAIYVQDMVFEEKKLHNQFKKCNIKLLKSKEWFDFNPLDFIAVNLAFHAYEKKKNFSFKIGYLMIAILSLALLSNEINISKNKPIRVKNYELPATKK